MTTIQVYYCFVISVVEQKWFCKWLVSCKKVTLHMQTVKAPVSPHRCAGSQEPSLLPTYMPKMHAVLVPLSYYACIFIIIRERHLVWCQLNLRCIWNRFLCLIADETITFTVHVRIQDWKEEITFDIIIWRYNGWRAENGCTSDYIDGEFSSVSYVWKIENNRIFFLSDQNFGVWELIFI